MAALPSLRTTADPKVVRPLLLLLCRSRRQSLEKWCVTIKCVRCAEKIVLIDILRNADIVSNHIIVGDQKENARDPARNAEKGRALVYR